MDNVGLEDFIADSSNMARYEELIKMISETTLLTLMVSRSDLSGIAENGIIEMESTCPLGFLYLDDVGGHYATVYTSEGKMKSVSTDIFKYSQVVNFSQLTNYVLNDDLDGIIINPNTDNVVLTREVLLEYGPFVEDLCNDSRLNTAIMNMFLIEEGV